MKATGSSAVLSVSDFQAALAFYRDVLEFTIEFEFGEYAGVKTGDASLHLSSGNPKSPGSGHVYFFCDEVDDYFHLIKQRGASIRRTIENSPYGMRDFEVEDLDGNILVFGCDLEGAA
ncbi:MAG: VOC family protein [Proteobacteria bacterium]|jgi:uncharacterized glyoxalase superfamily protein PhnB|nr:VOC family protein [Pseudomonadota bacterium]MBT6348102.1 VOC family protein [Pseudomonadota bacterium]